MEKPKCLKPVLDRWLLGSNTRPSGSGLGAALADLTRGRALLGAFLRASLVNFALHACLEVVLEVRDLGVEAGVS